MRVECLCIAGPTAAGKSAAALAIAAALAPAEIVSVDSAQVYRGMDIGTAKPSAAERAAVPHHLIDLVEPSERYSAARFAADAGAAIAAIGARGALPLLVGGTMLYFKALFEGLAPMPGADATVRAAIDAEAARRGWPALHAELAAVDPKSAARIAPNDAQRLQRALEVWRLSGTTLSEWHAKGRRTSPAPVTLSEAKGPGAANDEILRFAQDDSRPMISLEPRDRVWLHARIEARFAAMLDAGLLDEVRRLRARGDLDPSLPSMRAVGYRQAWAALDAGDTSRLLADGSAATRRLAKRQLTWLRALPARHVVAGDDADAIERAVGLARRLVERRA